jgi:hypothetical protein
VPRIADLVIAKSSPLKFVNRLLGHGAILKKTDDDRLFCCCHVFPPLKNGVCKGQATPLFASA